MIGYWYFVEGINPEPWKAPESSVGRRGGGTFVQLHSPESMRVFKESFADEFKAQNPDYVMMKGKLALTIYLCRQVAPYEKAGGGKARANVADTTNMQKLIEDSLQGILYENDQSNLDVRTVQLMQGEHAEPMILIHLTEYKLPTEILKYMYERQAVLPDRSSSNELPDERGTDGLF